MLIDVIPKAYFDRKKPKATDGFSSSDFRNNFLALAQGDFMPCRAISSFVLETHDFGTDATAAATYAGTGVTVTKDKVNNYSGSACLKLVIDSTGNRQVLRTALSPAIDISSFGQFSAWIRCNAASSGIQLILRDGSGNESYWNITTHATPDTYEQASLVLASPDSNNGTPAVLTNIVSYGFKGLDASAEYYVDEESVYLWAMKIYISPTYCGDYFYPVSFNGVPVKSDCGLTGIITAPSAHPRIDLVSLTPAGALVVTTGAEVASPVFADIPAIPEGNLPLYALYIPTTATKIVENHLKDGYTSDGYVWKDLRPFYVQVKKSEITINPQTANYTLVIGDAFKLVDMDKSTAVTLTVPKNSSVGFAIGTIIAIRQKGAGQVTIAPVDGDVTLQYQEGLKTSAQHGVAALLKVATDTWVATGSLEA